jgi:hypothetical protein
MCVNAHLIEPMRTDRPVDVWVNYITKTQNSTAIDRRNI